MFGINCPVLEPVLSATASGCVRKKTYFFFSGIGTTRQLTTGNAFFPPLACWPMASHICVYLVVMLTHQLCLWSPRGHGRVGLVGAVLLGRLYGCTADDALLRVQVCLGAPSGCLVVKLEELRL